MNGIGWRNRRLPITIPVGKRSLFSITKVKKRKVICTNCSGTGIDHNTSAKCEECVDGYIWLDT